MNQKIRYTLLAFLVCTLSYSQTHTGKLNDITADGLHKLELTSDLRSATKDNFDHFRILDSDGNEVPYVLLKYRDQWLSEFVPVEIASKTVLKDSLTSLIFKNENKILTESVTLEIANTGLTKRYAVYGSNDNENWYGLIANKELSGLSLSSATEIKKTLFFPMNDYSYLRIDFDDKRTAPINILGAGNYTSRFFKRQPVMLQELDVEITQNKTEKRTEIKVTTSHTIDVIAFDIETTYFQRNAVVFTKRTRERKKKIESYDYVLRQFELNSNSQNWFDTSNLNEDEFYIHIDNQDNPPLEIDNIQLFQKPLYLVANLTSDVAYKIVVDTTLDRPSYDLKNFVSNQTEVIDEATIEELSPVKMEEATTEDFPFWKTNTFMWICLVLGSLVIVYIAVGLLKDVKTKESS